MGRVIIRVIIIWDQFSIYVNGEDYNLYEYYIRNYILYYNL